MNPAALTPSDRRIDRGFTLPELLVVVIVSGMLVTALAFAFSTVVRGQDGSMQRLTESKDVTFVQTWIAADLSSATESWIEPVLPFDVYEDLVGTNVLTLRRPDVDTGRDYLIAYRYEQDDSGQWILARYRIDDPGCPGPDPVLGSCSADESVKRIGVAYELPAPPAEWTPGQAPTHAVEVRRRNGSGPSGGGTDGRPVGEDVTVHFRSGSIFIAGGTGLSAGQMIEPDPAVIPDPTAPPSRCGRRIQLILDLSGSILNGGQVAMRDSATGFVRAFSGTPSHLNVVGFAYWIDPLSSDEPGEYYDMLNDPNGTTQHLIDDVFEPMATSGNPFDGGTNWEVAMMGTYAVPDRWAEGDPLSSSIDRSDIQHLEYIPDLVVFVTDGQPTVRLNNSMQAYYHPQYWSRSSEINRNASEAAYHLNIARELGVDDVIGVLVGQEGDRNDARERFATVVGEVRWTPTNGVDPAEADYFEGDFDDFEEIVDQIVQRECGGALTLQKRFSDGTDPDTTGVWEFASSEGTMRLDHETASSVTFQYKFQQGETQKAFWVDEQPRDGWVLQDVTCEMDGVERSDLVTAIAPENPADPVRYEFTLQADKALSCLMVSAPE